MPTNFFGAISCAFGTGFDSAKHNFAKVQVKVISKQQIKDGLFFLTRDGDVEIRHSAGNKTVDEPALFHYANQWLAERPLTKDIDEFGRNYTDKLFIRLCIVVLNYVNVILPYPHTFVALSCKKVGEQYVAKLELSNETLEMELAEMVALLEARR